MGGLCCLAVLSNKKQQNNQKTMLQDRPKEFAKPRWRRPVDGVNLNLPFSKNTHTHADFANAFFILINTLTHMFVILKKIVNI